MVDALKRFFGPTEVYVGTIEADIDPIPVPATEQGREEQAKRFNDLLEGALRTAQQAHISS